MNIWQQFLDGLAHTLWYEYLAVASGIASVWFSRRENILVYPVGLVNTVLYVWLSIEGDLFGEAAVNFYYTVMSIYGWIAWSRRDQRREYRLHITRSDRKWWSYQIAFFLVFYAGIYGALYWLQQNFAPGAIPWADALASASAFTAMWLMTRKKLESWYWWIVTNVASIPLYFVKGYVVTSVYYFILLVMAFWGLKEWNRRLRLTANS